MNEYLSAVEPDSAKIQTLEAQVEGCREEDERKRVLVREEYNESRKFNPSDSEYVELCSSVLILHEGKGVL